MKTIRVPLTDLYGRDIMTGKIVDNTERQIEVENNQKKKMSQVSQKIKETQNQDGKVFVSGLGRVPSFIS